MIPHLTGLESFLFHMDVTLDDASSTEMGMNSLSKTFKYEMHKATLAASGEDLISELDKTLSVYFKRKQLHKPEN